MKKQSIFEKRIIVGTIIVLALSLIGSILALLLPRVASEAINNIFQNKGSLEDFKNVFLGYAFIILIVSILQTIISNVITEYFAAKVRARLINKVSKLSYNTVNALTSSKLLTNLTSDVDAVKSLFNQGIISIFSSLALIIGASISMISINRDLGLLVITTIPLLFITFGVIFGFISKYFKKAQENLDVLNRIINESIIGSALIKVLNSGKWEINKFNTVNEESRKISLKIVTGFASLIPVITILSNLAILAVVYIGGQGVIDFINSRTTVGLAPGDYAAFFSYVGTFIGPIFILGFVSSTIARSVTSIKRIQETLSTKDIEKKGTTKKSIKGEIEFEKVNLEINNRSILKDISFKIKPGTRNAIVGPTAAGKTQIFNLIAGLQDQTNGKISIDNVDINDFDTNNFYEQVALVFQDSIIFNTTIRENILFNAKKDNDDLLNKAIQTAELDYFINAQSHGINTIISERGSSLSGGQKQRLTLARALAIDPKVLLLDDFTARVDIKTEKNIIDNLKKNYPELTLISITQKIESIKEYDQILLIMEGELIAAGTHEELLKNSFEYQQILNSQKSTE
jgi:ATP-binding cassette subfamily B protein